MSKKENQQLSLLPITTHTTQRSNNHQPKVGSVRELTTNRDETTRENYMEALGGIQETHGDIRLA